MKLVLKALILTMIALAGALGQTRSLAIVTEPGAAVWIDGIRIGTTGGDGRLAVKMVGAQAHSVKVRADGYAEKSQAIAATSRGDVKVSLAKTSDKGELAFQEAERLATSDREKAIAAYRKAIELRPAYTDAYIALARQLSDNGDYDDARKALAAVRRIKPGLAEASAVEGRIFKESGEEEKAVAAFKRAITEGRGTQAEAYTGLGLLFKERAETSGGTDPEAERANYAESAKYLKVAIKQLGVSPDAMVIYQLLGLVYERTNQNAQAIAIYKEFLVLFPDTAEASAVQSFIVQLQKQP